ncbi:MAG: DUF421 domain-containing protein [Clostridia bacterium]|nr:DUF421 domain-containing protein [Clostridia bacterium]
MAIIFVRSLIIYITLLVVMRFMGKRQIGEMQPFEFIVTLLISELACIPMSDISVPLLYGVLAVLAVFVLHQFITILEQSGAFFKLVISGKPSVVINKNGVDFKELKKNNLDVSDLIESMRNLGYFSLDAVEYAIYEANGTLSAIKKEEENTPPVDMPLLLITNGKTVKKNLKATLITEQDLNDIAKSHGANGIKEVGVFTIDGNGRYYFQQFNKKYVIGNYKLKEGVNW